MNTRYMCIILVVNIIWRSGHAIRSFYLLDSSFLHHSWCSRQFYTTQRCNTIVLVTHLMGTHFRRQIVLSIHKKNGQGELARHLNRLFLNLNTVINQKMQKKSLCHGHFNWIITRTFVGNKMMKAATPSRFETLFKYRLFDCYDKLETALLLRYNTLRWRSWNRYPTEKLNFLKL